MVKINLTHTPLLDTQAAATVFFLEQDFDTKIISEIAVRYFPDLIHYMQDANFHAKASELLAVPTCTQKKVHTLFFVGLGKKDAHSTIDIEMYRRALGCVIKTMQSRKIDNAAMMLPAANLFDVTDEYLARETAIISTMAAYRFDEFITDPERKVKQDLALECHSTKHDKKAIELGLKKGSIIACAVNKVRHWIDLPPVSLTPVELADKAIKIAKEHKLEITVFGEPEIKKMGMGGLAAVSAGSEQDCKFVVMHYKTEKRNAPTVAFVGKGITFDSGGLSIKPAEAMESMKTDMSGAAAVIGVMDALAQLKPEINIVAIAPLSENLPSDKATKPGDIVRFYNGKTAEIKNTDAEGRLILADALSYTVKHYKPDAMIDLATLTGACAYALGPFYSGMMTQHEEVAQRVKKAAEVSGDRVWALPFNNDYKGAIKSDVADMSNIGNKKYMAGAITAGFFLQNFVDDTPWVHIDIAGTAFDVPGISYYANGATGAGVRLLIDLALQW